MRDHNQEAGEPGYGVPGIPHAASVNLPRHRTCRERFSFLDRSGQPIVFTVFALENTKVLDQKCDSASVNDMDPNSSTS